MKRIFLFLLLSSFIFETALSQIVFKDDFISNSKNWTVKGTEMYLKAGKYHVFGQQSGQLSFMRNNVTDGKIEITTNYESGVEGQGYGLYFRGKDTKSGYLFLIAAAGYYHLGVQSAGNYTKIINWTPSEIINKKSNNTLSVTFKGANIIGYINGKQVFSVNNTTVSAGGFGMYSAKGVHASFDNLKVWKNTGNASSSENNLNTDNFNKVWKLVDTKMYKRGVDSESKSYQKYIYTGTPGNIHINFSDTYPGFPVKKYNINWKWNKPPDIIRPGTYLRIPATCKILSQMNNNSDIRFFTIDWTKYYRHDFGSSADIFISGNETSVKGSGNPIKMIDYPKGKTPIPSGNVDMKKCALRIGFSSGAAQWYCIYYIYEWVE